MNRRWGIQRRLSTAAAAAVAIAVALASVGAYVAVRAKLRGEVDGSLRNRVSEIQNVAARMEPFGVRVPAPIPHGAAARFGGAQGMVQYIDPDGDPRPFPPVGLRLPVDAADQDIARGAGDTNFEDQRVAGHHFRVLTAAMPGGGAIQVARPLDEVDSVLNGLLLLLAGITIGGVVLAAVLGGLVSRASLRPVRRFTEETESIASAPDLGRRLEADTDD